MSDAAAADESARHSADEVWALQPGLARLMPEIGARFWKCWYAAEARNWELARWQLREMVKLFRLGNQTRPKYIEDVDTYLSNDVRRLGEAIDHADFDAFCTAYDAATDRANQLHGKWNKPFIVWKLPGMPPPDLDLSVRHPSTGGGSGR